MHPPDSESTAAFSHQRPQACTLVAQSLPPVHSVVPMPLPSLRSVVLVPLACLRSALDEAVSMDPHAAAGEPMLIVRFLLQASAEHLFVILNAPLGASVLNTLVVLVVPSRSFGSL